MSRKHIPPPKPPPHHGFSYRPPGVVKKSCWLGAKTLAGKAPLNQALIKPWKTMEVGGLQG